MGILCELPYGKKIEHSPRVNNHHIQISSINDPIIYPKESLSKLLDNENTDSQETPHLSDEAPSSPKKSILKRNKTQKEKSIQNIINRNGNSPKKLKLDYENSPKKVINEIIFSPKKDKNEEEKLSLNINKEKTKNNNNDDDEFFLPVHPHIKDTSNKVVNKTKTVKIKFRETTKKFNESEQEVKKFMRRKKRSSTLVDKTNMFLSEMQLSVSNELLVMHQKGRPTDRYRKGKLIGTGAFGSVYEAKNIIFNNLVAMKVIEKREGNEVDEKLILNEINILTKLSHPNIVKIYEFFDSNNYYYIVTEYCKCGELFGYIRNGLTEHQLAVLFYQVFSGLWYLHENKILHRDIKLENILISEKENDIETNEEYFWIKIIDFGTSKIFEKTKKERALVGSAYYIAPEVINHYYNEKCDIWSVGVILYMALVGIPPFDGAADDEIIENIKKNDYNKDVPKLLNSSEEVRDLLSKLLDKNDESRYNAEQAINHPWFKKFNGRKLFYNFKEEDIKIYINNLINYYYTSKIQSLVIAFLVHNLPNTKSSNIILKVFRNFNTSGNCKLTKEELANGLLKYTKDNEVIEKIDNIYSMLDSDNNGYIEFEEFLRACIDKKEVLTDANMNFAFKFLDKDNTGTLNASKIMEAFLKKSNPIIENTFHNTLLEVDDTGDGIIDFEHFKKLMLKTMEG